MSIDTELDRLLDEADHREAQAEKRSRLSRGVFESHRRRIEADDDAHPLARRRVRFREGLTVRELSERSTVAASVIHAIESGDERGSDRTWARLCLALSCRRQSIDPNYIYTS